MSRIAFYAPMKPADDPVPSGDRTVGRALIAALGGLGEVWAASALRSRDGAGDARAQDAIFDAAEAEFERLCRLDPPALWLTYHSYYKAPDLLGPALSRRWRIPYVQVEATRARKRLEGPYARFAAAAEAACDAARLVFHFTQHDREALARYRPTGQRIMRLRPFLARETLAPMPARRLGDVLRLLAVGMFRTRDKLDSYAALADALALVTTERWRLTIAGDGPERDAVEGLFARFGERVVLAGQLGPAEMRDIYRNADLLVWPGVGEAFGMAYLEAQAEGCPVLAEDRPGVRDVVRAGGRLTPPGDAAAYAAAIDRLAASPDALLETGRLAQAQVAADHLLPAARATLAAGLSPLLEA
jgi:glycosyltransferase involved in cell wall biosynthesis